MPPSGATADFHPLRLAAGALAVHGKTDAAAQAAPLAIRTARGKAIPVGKFKRRVQNSFEIAAVVDIAAGVSCKAWQRGE